MLGHDYFVALLFFGRESVQWSFDLRMTFGVLAGALTHVNPIIILPCYF